MLLAMSLIVLIAVVNVAVIVTVAVIFD